MIMSRKKGYKHSKETKKKIGAKSKGRKHSTETKEKISLTHQGEKNHSFGKPAANRGKRMSKKQRKRLSEIHKKRFAEGATTWNEGKTGLQVAWNKGAKGLVKGWWLGKKLSKKHRQHLSKAHKGILHSEETKQKIRDAMKEYWSRRKEEK